MRSDLTFVVPVYERVAFLPATLDSVKSQSLSGSQILVVDDGSKADVRQAVAPYEPWVRFVEGPHGGVSSARNRGMALVETEFVAFLDSDDLVSETYAERMLQALSDGAGVAYCDFDAFAGESPGEGLSHVVEHGDWSDSPLEWLLGGNLPTGSYVARTDIARQIGFFDTKLAYGEDWDWTLRLAESAKWVYVPERLFHYRQTPDSASKNFEGMYEQPRLVLDRHLVGVTDPRLLARAAHYRHAQSLTTASRIRRHVLNAFRQGKATQALARVARFLVRHPSMVPYLFRRFPKTKGT